MTLILGYFYDVIDVGFSAIGSYSWLESRADGMTISKRLPKSKCFFAEFQ